MRIKLERPALCGDTREKEGFLWFPKKSIANCGGCAAQNGCKSFAEPTEGTFLYGTTSAG